MKKAKKILIVVIVVLLVLLVPYDRNIYDDGGTIEYQALSYKYVKWVFMNSVYDDTGKMVDVDIEKKNSIYLFPTNFKDISELKAMEREKMQ